LEINIQAQWDWRREEVGRPREKSSLGILKYLQRVIRTTDAPYSIQLEPGPTGQIRDPCAI